MLNGFCLYNGEAVYAFFSSTLFYMSQHCFINHTCNVIQNWNFQYKCYKISCQKGKFITFILALHFPLTVQASQ